MTIHDSYLAVAEESTYGTAVAPTRYFELLSEGINGVYERVTSDAMRKGQKTASADRFVVNPKGAEGEIELEVLDKGFGVLFKHMLGAIATSGVSSPYTHTATVGDLAGKSLTVQVGRADVANAVVPFTYEGGKVDEWELTNEVDGILMLKLKADFEKETIGAGAGAYALATPTYPSGAQLYSFTTGSVTIDGQVVPITDFALKAKNGLKTDRYVLGTTTKREPLEEAMREFEFEIKADFEGTTQVNRVASATAAGAVAALVVSWETPGGYSLTLNIPNGRFDEFESNYDGGDIIELSLKGMALTDASLVSPVSLEYVTSDATP